jgi:hypothetical protein
MYLRLSAHSSRAAYDDFQSGVQERYPDSAVLSFDQVRHRLHQVTGVTSLHFDMCPNSCLAYTGPFSRLQKCPHCQENRYSDQDLTCPRRQFITLPLGPQLQALWQHPESVAKLRNRLRRTQVALTQSGSLDRIQDYYDICCGSEYLGYVRSGDISDNDMLLVLSMDGAQLYRDKESDAWFGVAMLVDYAPDIRHLKENVLPLFVIGGPNAPKDYDSFLFPTFAHLAACQRLGLPIWDSSTNTTFLSRPWFAFGTADTVGMAKLSGSVGHHGRNGCRLLCSMQGRHKPRIGTYYPAMLCPHGDDVPPGARHPSISIESIQRPQLTNTIRDWSMSLLPCLCASMKSVGMTLGFASRLLLRHFRKPFQSPSAFLPTPCTCLGSISVSYSFLCGEGR